MSFYIFSKDLKDLYFRIGISGVEDLYIKCAQAYTKSLSRWLLENDNIKKSLNIPGVYDALKTLSVLRQKYPSDVSSSILLKYFMSHTTPSLPIIIAFNNLLVSDVENILSPFKDIIIATINFKGETPDPQLLEKDLSTIQNAFTRGEGVPEEKGLDLRLPPHKRTAVRRKLRMFSQLLQKFSDEISTAATRSGLEDFGNVIRDGGLTKAQTLSEYVEGFEIDAFLWGQARRMVQYVLKNVGDLNFIPNYNFVKEKSMDFVGLVDPIELANLYNRREENIDTTQLMDPNMVDERVLMEDIETLNMTDAQLLNPSFLALLAAFFIVFYSQLR